MATKAIRGNRTNVLIGGINASPFLNQYSEESKREELTFAPLGQDDVDTLSGSNDVTVTLEGAWNGDEDSLDAYLDDLFGGDIEGIITACLGGYTDTSKGCYLLPGTQISVKTEAPSDDITTLEAEFKTKRNRGRIVAPRQTSTATGTGGFEWESPAATSKGLVAHFHIFGLGGTVKPTSVVPSIEHSADGSTYAPLIAGVNMVADGKGGYRLETGDTVTVNEFVQAKLTITGGTAPTVDWCAAAARRK